jgi:hypothetical protein
MYVVGTGECLDLGFKMAVSNEVVACRSEVTRPAPSHLAREHRYRGQVMLRMSDARPDLRYRPSPVTSRSKITRNAQEPFPRPRKKRAANPGKPPPTFLVRNKSFGEEPGWRSAACTEQEEGPCFGTVPCCGRAGRMN